MADRCLPQSLVRNRFGVFFVAKLSDIAKGFVDVQGKRHLTLNVDEHHGTVLCRRQRAKDQRTQPAVVLTAAPGAVILPPS